MNAESKVNIYRSNEENSGGDLAIKQANGKISFFYGGGWVDINNFYLNLFK